MSKMSKEKQSSKVLVEGTKDRKPVYVDFHYLNTAVDISFSFFFYFLIQ